ncbi:hypothetical protein EYF80_027928 [Liparis tanakae]|uniref:Uncharacterized protein n=1 Tax=Liparis tanakae TaxID=230148 RepID=A0A4Z2H843_9TELE|nr:hypothetical protein EYF80_027928 [Liparis tanakae]
MDGSQEALKRLNVYYCTDGENDRREPSSQWPNNYTAMVLEICTVEPVEGHVFEYKVSDGCTIPSDCVTTAGPAVLGHKEALQQHGPLEQNQAPFTDNRTPFLRLTVEPCRLTQPNTRGGLLPLYDVEVVPIVALVDDVIEGLNP